MDLLEFRLQCRISCGANHVVHNVLPFLMSPDFVRSYVYVDADDDDDEDNDDISDDEVEDNGEDDSNLDEELLF